MSGVKESGYVATILCETMIKNKLWNKVWKDIEKDHKKIKCENCLYFLRVATKNYYDFDECPIVGICGIKAKSDKIIINNTSLTKEEKEQFFDDLLHGNLKFKKDGYNNKCKNFKNKHKSNLTLLNDYKQTIKESNNEQR